jgi:preprotein translocase subunit SecG
MLQTFINIVHIFVCLVLMGVVLLQQGKGGGMGAAFGGATTQVFGGRGAGNILTRATAICAAIFMITSVSLAYLSSSGDRALKAKVAQEAGRKKDKGQLKERSKDAPAPSESAPAPAPEGAPTGEAPTGETPAPAPSPAPTP